MDIEIILILSRKRFCETELHFKYKFGVKHVLTSMLACVWPPPYLEVSPRYANCGNLRAVVTQTHVPWSIKNIAEYNKKIADLRKVRLTPN